MGWSSQDKTACKRGGQRNRQGHIMSELEKFGFYPKSNGSHQSGETMLFVMLKVMLWLLCGECIREGWAGEVADQLGGWCSQAGKRWSWLVTIVAGDKEMEIFWTYFCLSPDGVPWESPSTLVNTSYLQHLLSVPMGPHPLLSLLSHGQWSPPYLLCFLSGLWGICCSLFFLLLHPYF